MLFSEGQILILLPRNTTKKNKKLLEGVVVSVSNYHLVVSINEVNVKFSVKTDYSPMILLNNDNDVYYIFNDEEQACKHILKVKKLRAIKKALENNRYSYEQIDNISIILGV